MRHRMWMWLRRYGPAELAATAGALIGAAIGNRYGGPAGAAIGGVVGESLAFYGFVVVRELRTARDGRRVRRVLSDLLVEFGPAEVLDTVAVRPAAMYAGPLLVGDLLVGILAGKVAADLVFYAIAAAGHELSRRIPEVADPLTPTALDAGAHRTPYLLVDLGRVVGAYRTLAAALPVDDVHYAVKCNPDPRILGALHRSGCRFEIASFPELAALRRVGVRPADVLFSNPVKPPEHIGRAHRAGCWRFAVDSPAELHKVAAHAPGAAVYVRMRTKTAGAVPSEGKFGVDPDGAFELLVTAADLGLRPYGVTFHVGSQTTWPDAWGEPIDEIGVLAVRLTAVGIRLEMIDIGGGFPADYSEQVPPMVVYGRQIGQALDRLPYRPRIVAEPGRALVAEAGVLVSTVIGTARRNDRDWVHIDVGAFNGLMESLETANSLAYPVSDSRRTTSRPCHLTGPSCDSQDTILFDTTLSADLTCGDRVYIGTAGAYTTAYAAPFNGFDVPRTHCVPARAVRDGSSTLPPPSERATAPRPDRLIPGDRRSRRATAGSAGVPDRGR